MRSNRCAPAQRWGWLWKGCRSVGAVGAAGPVGVRAEVDAVGSGAAAVARAQAGRPTPSRGAALSADLVERVERTRSPVVGRSEDLVEPAEPMRLPDVVGGAAAVDLAAGCSAAQAEA